MRAEWFPCENPERPPDEDAQWHLDGCRGCALAASAAAVRDPSAFRVFLARFLNREVVG